MTDAHHIYIHVPYCVAKCNYCAFYSHACQNPDWGAYADGICQEIQQWAARLGKIAVPTVFFGGGTPSLMPVDVFAKIMTQVRHSWHLSPGLEVTLEANPGTLDAARLHDFIAAGVNRLSIGVQSFDDDELRFLGRRHQARAARQLIDAALARGLRVSADFIYGLPDHDVGAVRRLCQQINETGLRHCSLYELTIEPGTAFGRMNLTMPDNSMMADMYNAITDTLNLQRYEVSNYAAAGDECRHNLKIWDGEPYVGLGRGAAGRVLIDGQWYEQSGGASGTITPLDNTTRAIEKVMTGMRTRRGVYLSPDVRAVLDWTKISRLGDQVRVGDDNRLVATEKGLLILDNLLLDLVK